MSSGLPRALYALRVPRTVPEHVAAWRPCARASAAAATEREATAAALEEALDAAGDIFEQGADAAGDVVELASDAAITATSTISSANAVVEVKT